MNDIENGTNFARATRSMRWIILIFIMCDLALAGFAARELFQESERESKGRGSWALPRSAKYNEIGNAR